MANFQGGKRIIMVSGDKSKIAKHLEPTFLIQANNSIQIYDSNYELFSNIF